MGGLECRRQTMRNVFSSGMCASEVEMAITMTGNAVSYIDGLLFACLQ